MTPRLAKVGGQVVDLLGNAGAAATITKQGNFQSYAANPYSAYTGMWGHYRSELLVAESSMTVTPSTFPAGTVFNWDVTPAPDWGGVNGYLHLDYGNYDWSPGTITPRQVKNITDLTLDVGWTYQGDPSSGLLSELWLSSQAAPSGQFPKIREIGFFPKFSPGAQAFVASLPNVSTGSFVDSAGLTWNVKKSAIYYIAYRPGYADFQGVLPYLDYLEFLQAAGEITGDEWYNGVAFGVEPFSGAGSMTITEFAPTYSGV